MIKLDNVSKYYYSANAVVPALKKIQLEFSMGEFVAITGESGSGKTTLLNIISGLDTFDDGELYLNGEPTSHFDEEDWEEYRKNKIGFVFANNNLIDHYTALQTVISSLLIQGTDVHKANQIALELLEQVGMSNYADQKAEQLSSGQRQRLAIARALAKNTDIIVADEPTANLDSITGKQIIELLSKISEHKLIILVTHNYDEVESYVTRKIRIQDGQVVLDVPVGQDREEEAKLKPGNEGIELLLYNGHKILAEPGEKKDKSEKPVNSAGTIARRFARMNLTCDIRKSLFIFIFIFFAAIVSFIAMGIFCNNKDDISTKKYDKTIFAHEDLKRIVVRHPDGSEITPDDMKFFQSAANVKIADMYDYANDINYYSVSDSDYKNTYSLGYTSKGVAQVRTINFVNKNHFMKSATCIKQDDLREGTIPEDLFDIAVYSEDSSLIGTTLDCYFTADNIWSEKQYYFAKCKITGILKNDSDQIFFSGKLCSMLSDALSNNEYITKYDSNGEGLGYKGFVSVVPVIGEDLEYNQIRITQEQLMTTNLHPIGKAELDVHFADEYGASSNSKNYDMEIISDTNVNNTWEFIEISESLFNELFSQNSTQASLYIDDYVNMDKVLKVLKDQGYDAVSTYRTAAIKYIPEKVNARMSMLLACIGILFMLSIFEMLIISSYLRIKSRNFEVLKSMGMNYKAAKRITYYELAVYSLIASMIVIGVAVVSNYFGWGYSKEFLKYFTMKTYMTYFAYNIVLSVLSAFTFNRYLYRKMERSSYDKNR